MVTALSSLALEPWAGARFVFDAHLPPKMDKEKVPHEATPSVIMFLSSAIAGVIEDQAIHFICGFLVHAGKHMSVGIEGDAYICMTKASLDYLRAYPCLNQGSCVAVAQIV